MPSSEEVEAVSESLDETPLLWLLRSFLRVSSSTSSERKFFLVHIQSSSLLILELVTGSGTRKSRLRIQEVSLRNGFSPSFTICDNLWAYFNFFQRIAWQLGIVEIWNIIEYYPKFVEKIRKAVISCYQIHFSRLYSGYVPEIPISGMYNWSLTWNYRFETMCVPKNI